jgi:hypothetical protein
MTEQTSTRRPNDYYYPELWNRYRPWDKATDPCVDGEQPWSDRFNQPQTSSSAWVFGQPNGNWMPADQVPWPTSLKGGGDLTPREPERGPSYPLSMQQGEAYLQSQGRWPPPSPDAQLEELHQRRVDYYRRHGPKPNPIANYSAQRMPQPRADYIDLLHR